MSISNKMQLQCFYETYGNNTGCILYILMIIIHIPITSLVPKVCRVYMSNIIDLVDSIDTENSRKLLRKIQFSINQ